MLDLLSLFDGGGEFQGELQPQSASSLLHYNKDQWKEIGNYVQVSSAVVRL